jgi:hypothetical protein
LLAAVVALTPVGAGAQPTAYESTTVDGRPAVVVSGGDNGIEHPNQGTSVTWTNDRVWVLDGLVFVNEEQTLTIEPGTVVKGKDGDGKNASGLVVARGGTLKASGTADAPIIFTAMDDDLSTTDDLPANYRGGWGGIIIMGRAPLNTTPNVLNVEGITLNEIRNQYGGTDPNDSSGTLRYVSIRYGGTILEEGNEINGLTLAGVGSGTTVEYVEVFNNQDDGFEFFGGTVDARYLVSAFTTDDSFDFDQGYRGRGQFWLAVQNSVYADHAAEHDGGEAKYGGVDATPYATPQIYNVTYVGSGLDGAGSAAITMRDNFAGSYFNSVFASFPGRAVHVEDVPGTDTGDSRARFEEGTLRLEGNVFYEIGGTLVAGRGSQFGGLVVNDGPFGDALASYLEDNNTMASLSPVNTLSRDSYGRISVLDPRGVGDALTTAGVDEPDAFFEDVDYVGAFDGSTNWALSWTFIGQGGTTHPGLNLLR